MDNDPSRRQYVPSSYATPQSQSATGDSSGQYGPPGAVERFRQSYLPTSASSGASRAGADPQAYYGFQQGAPYPGPGMQPNALYGQDMPPAEPQRQPTQQYSHYGGNLMYDMAQPPAPQTPQSSYDPQYRQRPNTATETLATQFGVPQPAQYYLAGQAGPTSAPAPDYSTHSLPSQYHQSEAYAQPGPSTQQPYPGAMMPPASSAQYPQFGQQPQAIPQQQIPQQQAQSNDQAFEDYQSSIRRIFSLAKDGSLRGIDQYLLHISQYLIGNAENLQLTKDDEDQQAYRMRVWNEFNRAWLTTLQQQHDLTEATIQNGQGLREPQSLMSAQTLEQIGEELVRLCSVVEKHGLVDYQMGVLEEEIIDLLLRCLQLLEPPDAGSSREGATAAGALRGG